MRKTVTLVLYLAMTVGGSWTVYESLVAGAKGVALEAGAFLALFGAYLLWTDFLSPRRERS